MITLVVRLCDFFVCFFVSLCCSMCYAFLSFLFCFLYVVVNDYICTVCPLSVIFCILVYFYVSF